MDALTRFMQDTAGRITALERDLERRKVEVAGRVACYVWKNVNQSIAHATYTPITFDQEVYDDQGMHSTVSNTSRVTVPIAGLYVFVGSAFWDGAVTTGIRILHLGINGFSVVTSAVYEDAGGSLGANGVFQNIAGMYAMSAGDYVEMRGYQDNGGGSSLNIGASGVTNLLVARVSP